MLRKLTNGQKRVLQAVIDETRRRCPPNTNMVSKMVSDGAAWRQLQALQKYGYIDQPHPSGAWIPLQDAEGRSMRLELVVVDENPAPIEDSTPGGSPPLDPAGSEGWPA